MRETWSVFLYRRAVSDSSVAQRKTVGTARPKPLNRHVVSSSIEISTWEEGDLRGEEQPATSLADGLVKRRGLSPDAARKEAKPKAEEHSRQDGSQYGSLDNQELIPREQHHEQNDLDNRSEATGLMRSVSASEAGGGLEPTMSQSGRHIRGRISGRAPRSAFILACR